MENTSYSVVLFIESNSVEAVCSNWLLPQPNGEVYVHFDTHKLKKYIKKFVYDPSWPIYQIQVLVENISTYKEAVLEANRRMNGDTDTNDELVKKKQFKRKHPALTDQEHSFDINEIFDKIQEKNQRLEPPRKQYSNNLSHDELIEAFTGSQLSSAVDENSAITSDPETNTNPMQSSITQDYATDQPLAVIDIKEVIRQAVSDEFNKFMLEFSKEIVPAIINGVYETFKMSQEKQIDELKELKTSLKDNVEANTTLFATSIEENKSATNKLRSLCNNLDGLVDQERNYVPKLGFASVDEVDEFEMAIHQREDRDKMIKYLNVHLISNGSNVLYGEIKCLLHLLFSPNILAQYSWKGVKIHPNSYRINRFKDLNNILNFMLDVYNYNKIHKLADKKARLKDVILAVREYWNRLREKKKKIVE